MCARKLMRHAQEGVEMGLGSEQGAMGVLKHANTHTNDTDGSTTAVVAVMHAPNVCEVCVSKVYIKSTFGIAVLFSFHRKNARTL